MSLLRTRVTALVLGSGVVLAGLGAVMGRSIRPSLHEGTMRHPHLHGAIHELWEARRELKSADHAFDDCRVETIKAIDHTIAELEKAAAVDRH